MKNGDLLCFEYHYLYICFTFLAFRLQEVYKMNDFSSQFSYIEKPKSNFSEKN